MTDTMKLSPDTLNVLKNFASINQSLAFKTGNVIATISSQKSTLAKAKVAESFPNDFAIYDLNEFLSAYGTLFNDPTIDIKDSHMILSEGKKISRLYFADESMIVTPPSDMSKMSKAMKNAEIKFLLTEEDLGTLLKGAGVFSSPEFAVDSDGKVLSIIATDTKNNTSNQFSIELGEGNGTSFHMVLKTENLKLLKGSYEVSISSQGISHFKHTEIDLEYFISLDQSSKYDI